MNLSPINSASDLFTDFNKPSIVILAIKPSSVQDFFKSLTSIKCSPPGLFVSICAGVTLKTLGEMVNFKSYFVSILPFFRC